MLETEIKKLTAAVEALNSKLSSGGDLIAAAAAPSEKVATPPAKKAAQASPAAAAPSIADELAITPETKPEAAPAAPAPATEAVTKDAVIAAVIELAKTKGRDAPVAIFTNFGITKATEATEAQYGELHAALVAAL